MDTDLAELLKMCTVKQQIGLNVYYKLNKCKNLRNDDMVIS